MESDDFDLGALLAESGETSVDTGTARILTACWERWCGLGRSETIHTEGLSVALVWLPEEVEAEVDAAWSVSPSRSLLLHYLADRCCRRLVLALVPEIETFGCAPVPPMTAELRAGLMEFGLVPLKSGMLPRRYAVLTPLAPGSGCDLCALCGDCPRQRQVAARSLLIPGPAMGG